MSTRCVAASSVVAFGDPGSRIHTAVRVQVRATRATLTPMRGTGIDPEPTRRWRHRGYTRTQREFLPDLRFGPEWSHINPDGTTKLNATQRRPKTIH